MSHSSMKNFASKHPDSKIDSTIQSRLQSELQNNKISCSAAHQIAKDLGMTPLQVGIQIDLGNYKITHCQMGLFGHKNKEQKTENFPDKLESLLENAKKDNTISCLSCWEIAETLKTSKPRTSRLLVGGCCNKLNIKIKPCQLGAF